MMHRDQDTSSVAIQTLDLTDQSRQVELFGRNLENEDVKTNQEIQNAINRVHYYDPPVSGGFRMGVMF